MAPNGRTLVAMPLWRGARRLDKPTRPGPLRVYSVHGNFMISRATIPCSLTSTLAKVVFTSM